MSENQFCDLPDGTRLCFRVKGEGAPILLVVGMGIQLIHWPQTLIDGLVQRGFRVITFDNRDVGLSTRSSTPLTPKLRLLFRQVNPRAYDLADLAADAAGASTSDNPVSA